MICQMISSGALMATDKVVLARLLIYGTICWHEMLS
jgi:hypothetical protein